ncbi:MAG: protein kinase [Rickettsiales bacterium]|jgi:serine/threonine protein kinase|nr:protein kinase [Rickettsiales bacterium]
MENFKAELREVSCGPASSVYNISNLKIEREFVAVKLYKGNSGEDEFLCAEGESNDEIVASTALPRVFGTGKFYHEEKQFHVILTEGFGRRNLRTLMIDNPKEARRIAIGSVVPLIRTLQVIQSKSFVHAELKPSNIFIRENDSLVIDNFRIAGYPANAKAGELDGVSIYAAPEIMRSGSEILSNHKAEIWSLGMIFIEIFSGVNIIEKEQINPRHNCAAVKQYLTEMMGNENYIREKVKFMLKNISDLDFFHKKVFSMMCEYDPARRPSAAQLMVFTGGEKVSEEIKNREAKKRRNREEFEKLKERAEKMKEDKGKLELQLINYGEKQLKHVGGEMTREFNEIVKGYVSGDQPRNSCITQ